MNLDLINADILEDALKAYRQAEDPPEDLLSLQLLSSALPLSRVEKLIHLDDYLRNTITRMLGEQRRLSGLPIQYLQVNPRKQDWLDELTGDFRAGNTDLEAWSALYHRYVANLSVSVEELASAAGVVPQQFRRRMTQGMKYLTGLVRRDELRALSYLSRPAAQYLPPPEYLQLFGVQPHVDRLVEQLTEPDGPRIVSLEGLGGIGKTALARAVAAQILQNGHLVEMVWVSARAEVLLNSGDVQPVVDPVRTREDVISRLAAQLGFKYVAGLPAEEKIKELQPALIRSPYLIVIDNLETVEDGQAIIPVLYSMTGATRFIVTTRYTLRDYSYLHVFSVPELSRKCSFDLFQSELERRGYYQTLTESEFDRVLAYTGGLPLALKLVAAQVGCYPLERIFSGMQNARQKASEGLYDYIYHRIWGLLDETGRRLLLAMLPIDPEGEDLSFLQSICGLSESEFERGLSQLLDYSLLEIAGSTQLPRYRLHRMTIAFLHTQLLANW